MSLDMRGVKEQSLGRPTKTVAVLLVAGLVLASVSACVSSPTRSTAATVAPTVLATPSSAASASPRDQASPVATATSPAGKASSSPEASSTPEATPALTGETIRWTILPKDSLPPIDTSTPAETPRPECLLSHQSCVTLGERGILEGWQGGYVDFVWHPATYRLTPWTSTDGTTWAPGADINAGSIWQSELATYNRTHTYGGSCLFVPTGWADDGRALVFRGRLNCALGCGSYWESSETMLVSTNGATWTGLDEKKVFGAGGIGRISGGRSGFAGLGLAGRQSILWTSQDGRTWQKQALPGELAQPGAGVADPASIDGALVLAGVRLNSGTPYGSASGIEPGPGVFNCDSRISDAPPPVYTPVVYTSSDGGSDWTAVTLPGAVKALEVSMYLVRIDNHTLVASEYYTRESGEANWQYWISSDGTNWKPTALTGLPATLEADKDGLLFSTQSCPADGFCTDLLSLYALTEDGELATLGQIGDIPALSGDAQVALGPAGILVSDGASTMWLGHRD